MRPTGARTVDHVIGGFPPGGLPLVLAGASGSGRTVLSLQLAQGALARGESVNFVSSEPAPSLIHQAAALGFDFEAAARSGRLVLLELDAAAPSLLRAQGVAAFAEALRAEAPEASLVILDPYTAVTAEIVDEPKLREVSRDFVRELAAAHLVLTVETDRLANQRGLERVLSELCGAYLALEREPGGRRVLAVEKSRSGLGVAERVEFAIGPGGTHVVEEAVPVAMLREAAQPASVPAAEPATAPAAASAEPAARATILVVEDSRLQRELVTDWLSERYEVVTAADGFEAMAVLLSRKPDLVILDLIMPRVTGYELLCALRRADLEVPVLVTSSRLATPGDRLGPLVLGATDFLPKPVNRIELAHKVDTLLRLRLAPGPRFEGAEVEALFGRVSHSRVLEASEFRERLARACSFGERYGLPSSLVRLEAPDAERLDEWLEIANQELRFEDAVLRSSKHEALALLVATEPGEAPKVIDRLLALVEEAQGAPHGFSVRVRPAVPADAEFEGLEALTEPGLAAEGEL